MLKLVDIYLPDEVNTQLGRYQSDIDILPDYTSQVNLAEQYWENRTNNRTFDVVREKLSSMCPGGDALRRCCYCEDSCATDVEHIWPKNLYPGKAFVWINYLYACGGCNSPKNNKFAVFTDSDVPIHVQRKPRDPILAPVTGVGVLIDPRTEDPLDFIWLDLTNSDESRFSPRKDVPTRDQARARYTIETSLELNRSPLPKARRRAYRIYKDLVELYILARNRGDFPVDLGRYVAEIKGSDHPSVWKEMQRQAQNPRIQAENPELYQLFQAAPEALTW